MEKSISRYAKSRDAKNIRDACNTWNASSRCEARKDRKTVSEETSTEAEALATAENRRPKQRKLRKLQQ